MFAFDLRAAMSQIWGKEDDRRDAFILIMRKHGIELGPTVLSTKQGSYRTDADSQEQGYRYIIVEAKNEIGSGGPEPLFQAIWYYQRSLEQIVDLERKEMRMLKYDDSSLPCFIIYLFARHMGAFKKAAIALQAACKIDVCPQSPKISNQNPNLSDDSQAECHFTYIRKIKQRLVFEAELANGGQTGTQKKRMSNVSSCNALRISSALNVYLVAGSWSSWITSIATNTPTSFAWNKLTIEILRTAMEGALDKLHQAGFAHGDVRDVNTMVNNNNPSEFMLVDFDWAGKIEEVRYPPNVNRDDIWRPDGVIDGEMVLPQHDMKMLQVMFEKISPDPYS
ncbi:hypothetical protein F5148DRAFT_1154835 [Russula earlei]|uniref:Uncharacterized protein n=1 Tax=Russula earlei TaxID=71964 RepID=A0ACC0TSM5_9AGAM|nr:hypothetical protein F5148DRAFT_1154835 [Russula earlei]